MLRDVFESIVTVNGIIPRRVDRLGRCRQRSSLAHRLGNGGGLPPREEAGEPAGHGDPARQVVEQGIGHGGRQEREEERQGLPAGDDGADGVPRPPPRCADCLAPPALRNAPMGRQRRRPSRYPHWEPPSPTIAIAHEVNQRVSPEKVSGTFFPGSPPSRHTHRGPRQPPLTRSIQAWGTRWSPHPETGGPGTIPRTFPLPWRRISLMGGRRSNHWRKSPEGQPGGRI
jgi:hypothetical protein